MHYGDVDNEDELSIVPTEEKKSESEATFYLSTARSICSSLSTKRSLYPPPSWPTSADLFHDSDVYPWQKLSHPTLRDGESDSLESVLGNGSITEAKGLAMISVLPSPVEVEGICPSLSSSTTVSVDTEEKKCLNVCGSACRCSMSSTASERTIVQRTPSKDEVKLSMPDFDLAPIAIFVDLPVSKKMMHKLCFSETLIISRDVELEMKEGERAAGNLYPQVIDSDRSEEVGGMCVSIQEASQNMVVFCTSQFSYDNSGATSSILSVVDRNLKLIEEKKTECLHRNDWKEERTLHVFREFQQLVAFRMSTGLEGVRRHRSSIDMKVEGDIVLDGGGFALMRHLILSKYKGEVEVWSMHISGELCRSAYSVGKAKVFIMNNRPIETIRIVKILIRANRKPDVSKSYFLPTGHMVRHRWMDCPYFLHMNPMSRIPPCNYSQCLENRWEEDVQLFSKYLDFKEENRARVKSFLEDNGEVKCMIKDYLLCLLQNKPRYVLDFTIEYFQKYLTEEK